MAEPVLDLRGVIHEYGTRIRTRVLHGVDLQIEPGEFTAVIGPSGSGNSTLLNLMGLLERPTGGSIRLDGVETAGRDEDRRATLPRLRLPTLPARFLYVVGRYPARPGQGADDMKRVLVILFISTSLVAASAAAAVDRETGTEPGVAEPLTPEERQAWQAERKARRDETPDQPWQDGYTNNWLHTMALSPGLLVR